MNSGKNYLLFTFILFILIGLSSSACSTNSQEKIFRNQTGTLWWTGPLAADGSGILFEVGDVQYGAPGTPEDYPDFFNQDVSKVKIKADFKLTGEETVRGWGATFPAIEFIRIERI